MNFLDRIPWLSGLLPNFLAWTFVLALILLWAAAGKKGKMRGWGTVFLMGFWLLGARPVAETILRPLEKHYQQPSAEELARRKIETVVVLTGGGYTPREEILSSALPHASLYRFMGGLELAALLGPECRIIFSGSAGRSRRDLATAEVMEKMVRALDPKRKVVSESRSGSTAEHPANVKPLVGTEPFALVTSAYHMPRSMTAFRRAGLDPVAYPVDFLARGGYRWMDWLPSAENYWKEEVVLREYLALAAQMVRGK